MRKIIKPRRLPSGWHNWALGVLCLVTLASAISSLGSSSSSSAAAQRTATVSRGIVQATVSGSGSLEAARQVELNFGATGEVTAVDVKAGEHVSKGWVLARINSSSARASLAQAKAQLAEAEETLEKAAESGASTASTTTATRGQAQLASTASADDAGSPLPVTYVSDSEGRAETDANPKSQTGATKETGETGSGDGGAANGKSEGGSGTKGSSKTSDPGSAATPTPSGEGSSKAPSSSSGSTVSGAAGSSAAALSVPTAEAKLREARLSVKSAQQEIKQTTLRAPISGTIAAVSGEVGETVSGEGPGAASAADSSGSTAAGAGQGGGESNSAATGSSEAFIVLSQLGRMKMGVSLSESEVNKVKLGQPVSVSISSVEGTELAGRVTHVDLLPSESSSASSGSVVSYGATVLLSQSEKGLRPGMSAKAEIVTEQVKNALAVSSEAITTAGPVKTVTVKEGDGNEVKRAVSTGLTGEETTQVISGLKAGDLTVLPALTVSAGGVSANSLGAKSPSSSHGGLPSFPSGGFPRGGFPGG